MRTREVEKFQGTDRFEVLRCLGAGGMGVVYEVYDRDRNIRVALKTLRQIDATGLYRFKHEFRGLAETVHPNLVPLYELISDGSTWFFTMELIDGVDFLSYVRAGQNTAPAPVQEETVDHLSQPLAGTVDSALPTLGDAANSEAGESNRTDPALPEIDLDFDRVRATFRQVAEGVLALHQAGKLHRDLKPANVLVRRDGQVVLLDFGLLADLGHRPSVHGESKPTGLLPSDYYESTDHNAAGTIAYMAPEQGAAQPLTPASDWYAFGVMLFQSLTGKLPFTGRPMQILDKKLQRDAPAPAELVHGIPEDLNTLCVELLRRDPAARPSGRDVLARLHGAPATADEAAESLPFVGRREHLAELGHAFEEMCRGRTVICRVHGRSGAGKSALLQHYLDGLSEQGRAVILTGRCYEQESVPFKAVDSLIDSLARYLLRLERSDVAGLIPEQVAALTRIFPVLRRVEAIVRAEQPLDFPEPRELRRKAFAALRALLARLAVLQPLVLALDDLQWGDADSAALLTDLLSPPNPPRVLVLMAYRSEYIETSACLKVLLAPRTRTDANVVDRELTVAALTPEETLELATGLLGHATLQTKVQAEQVVRESGGNPYFVLELVRHIKAGLDLTGASGHDLDEVLWRRVQKLDSVPRQLLEAIAVAGQPMRLRIIYQAAGLAAPSPHVLAQLRAAHLVRSTGPSLDDDVETYHDRVRESLTARLPATIQQCHHGGIAVALEASGNADPEAMAVHFHAADELAKAGQYYLQAAGQAEQALAFVRAAKLYRQSLDALKPAGAEDRRLRKKLGDALVNAGRGGEAAQVYERVCQGASGDERLELQQLAATQYCVSGHLDRGRTLFRSSLKAVGLSLPGGTMTALVSLLWHRLRLRWRGLKYVERDAASVPALELMQIDMMWSVIKGLSMTDTMIVADFQSRNLLKALQAGEPTRLARALAWETAFASAPGLAGKARTDLLERTAQELAVRLGDPYLLGLCRTASAIAAHHQGRFVESVEHALEAEDILRQRCTGAAWEIGTARTFIVYSAYYAGRFAEIVQRTDAYYADAVERGDLFAVTTLGTWAKPIVRLVDDDPDGALCQIAEALAQWPYEGFHIQHLAAMLHRAWTLLYMERGVEALQLLDEQARPLKRSLLLQFQSIRTWVADMRARCALDAAAHGMDREHWLKQAERAARQLQRERTPWGNAIADRVLGAVALYRGQTDAAVSHWEKAIAGLERHFGAWAAAVKSRLGTLLGGDRGRALCAEAQSYMQAQQVRNPEKMHYLYLPVRIDK